MTTSTLKCWTIRVRTVSLANQREHWARRHARESSIRWVVGATIGNRIRERLPCSVTLTRVSPRTLDDDNLRGALKAVRDAVADALRVKDNDPRVEWRYDQERGASREYAVRIAVRR